jgi:cation:H+ antiporter
MFNWLFDLFSTLSSTGQLISFLIFLTLGMALLVKGADFFVDGASSLAKILGVSTLIIGLTIVSFGTSAPEASVSIFSQVRDSSDISLGNVVGSNIFNTLVVLGMSAIYAPIIIHYKLVKREIPFMIFVTVLLFGLSIFINGSYDFALLQIEGVILLTLFVFYLYMNYYNAKQGKEVTIEIDEDVESKPLKRSIILLIIGMLMIIMGGEFVVHGAKNTALHIGVSEALVGLTVVALGTSLPELVTSVVAARKNENDIALGNIIGSNIFNILFILGLGSTIKPMVIRPFALFDFSILILITAVITWTIFRYKKIGRKAGILYLVAYAIYILYVILREVL